MEILQHQRAICGLSIDPFNDRLVATAGNDGRLLLYDLRYSVEECLVVSRSRKPFHGVMFHPVQPGSLVSANARDGVALWDLRATKHGVVRYSGSNGSSQNSMSVRFNATGSHILALRRRQGPVLYDVNDPTPVAQFYHADYYNSCTMKSCSFAGERDEFVLSGSDDFNLYMWRVPALPTRPTRHNDDVDGVMSESPHMVLSGHRSIVNQVRYNPHYCLIATSGVEKIIKIWSCMEYPEMLGSLTEPPTTDPPREIYSHEDYVSLVHHSGNVNYIRHNYSDQSTSEDPRMMAFFDNLVQRELECLGEESDSLADSSSPGSGHHSASEDSDQLHTSFQAPPPKRAAGAGARSVRGPHRVARPRSLAARSTKHALHRPHKRPPLRRTKQSRTSLVKTTKLVSGLGGCGKRAAVRRCRGPRRLVARPRAPVSHTAAPSSERTDSDEPQHTHLFRREAPRPTLRRRALTRTAKRKSKVTNYRKVMNLRSNGATQDSSDNYQNNFDSFEDNLAQPSTSSGYRGENTSSLFRIAEVDSDDDQSASSRPVSPRSQPSNPIPQNLISIIPTPLNGSRDSLADCLRVERSESDSGSTHENIRVLRRARRNGRLSLNLHKSDESNESTRPEELSPKPYNRNLLRLMNETNESELESSCSTESSVWPGPNAQLTPDSGVGTNAGSSARTQTIVNDVSDDSDYQLISFRQRVKKARRNYRSHMDSDSN